VSKTRRIAQIGVSLAFGLALRAHAQTATDASPAPADHVPPPAPAQTMESMSAAQMVDVMGMDDKAMFGLFAFDRLERVDADAGPVTSWSLQAWLGGDFDKFTFRSEGTRERGEFEHADVELLWSHAIAPFWDGKLGVRHDFGRGPDRDWIAFGAQGLAPYGVEIAATAYAGEHGRTALRFEAEYELLLSQRLILQPRIEFNAYGKSDRAADIGSGLADAEIGLRLRYEIRREFAPYIGVEHRHDFGATAGFVRAEGRDVADTQWIAGVRLWF
jgi:copper resistance protein B